MEKRALAVLLVFIVGFSVVLNSFLNIVFFGSEVFLSPPKASSVADGSSLIFMMSFMFIFIVLIAWAVSLDN